MADVEDGVKFDHYPLEFPLVFNASVTHGSHLSATWNFGDGVVINSGGIYSLGSM